MDCAGPRAARAAATNMCLTEFLETAAPSPRRHRRSNVLSQNASAPAVFSRRASHEARLPSASILAAMNCFLFFFFLNFSLAELISEKRAVIL